MTNRKISFGIFFVAMTTLLFELNLVKLYDTLWSSNLSYLVISLAMFALGLAGIFNTLFPIKLRDNYGQYRGGILVILGLLFAVSILGTFWVLDTFRFNFNMLKEFPLPAIRNVLISITYITIPFFLSGLILSALFSSFSKDIQKLYFFDLVGASLGCVLIIPLIPEVAPEGLIVIAAGLAMLAAAFFGTRKWVNIWAVLGIIICIVPFVRDGYISLDLHADKRGILASQHGREFFHWDPIARIDVIDVLQKEGDPEYDYRWIAYDGGNQTSYFYKFDGDFQKIRDDVENGKSQEHFWGDMVLASHYLKQDTNQDVLVIGSAGGQEMTAALTYGAKSVDAVELVGTVVELGKNQYAKFTGNIFNHPKINVQKGEGRSFLRATDKQYDIIQIMSNHASSSIASGSTAVNPTYLQTKEAYLEYFSHLKPDGVLHINHHVYHRMLATAATAWKAMGRTDFHKHVVLTIVLGTQDNLPTFMVKNSPWTAEEVEILRKRLHPARMMVNPLKPSNNPLFQRLMNAELTKADMETVPYQIRPTTDDHPYFNLLRKSRLQFNKTNYDVLLDTATARLLNSQIMAGLPMDVVHLYVVGGGASVFAILVILIPLLFSKVGRSPWPNKAPTLAYFAMLGLGFILFELISVHLFMRLIGYPLYTTTAVIFGYLLGAGLGSYASEKFGITPQRRWWLPFAGILITSIFLLLAHPAVIDHFLKDSQIIRIAVTLVMIMPVAFFLGMAFPLGVLRLSATHYAKQSIAWAWGINGVFTVIGGFLSVLLSIFFGFTITLGIAIVCYVLAMILFRRMTYTSAY